MVLTQRFEYYIFYCYKTSIQRHEPAVDVSLLLLPLCLLLSPDRPSPLLTPAVSSEAFNIANSEINSALVNSSSAMVLSTPLLPPPALRRLRLRPVDAGVESAVATRDSGVSKAWRQISSRTLRTALVV